MNTNELRIGNWLQYKNNPECAKYFKVEGLWKNTIAEIDYKEQVISGLSELVYEPIPLTPEILEKCKGLIQNTWIEKYSPIALRLTLSGWDIIVSGGDKIAEVKYLHQLQNLYFALTGEELNVQL